MRFLTPPECDKWIANGPTVGSAHSLSIQLLTSDPATPRKRNPGISQQVEEIVLHAMARDPNDRYPSALALKHDLDNPDAVEVTGRVDRLVEPVAWRGGWYRLRWYIAAGALPVAVLLVVVLVRHLQWK